MRTVVGIDLGTTNSLLALLVDGRPEVVPNHEGNLLTPSAVSIDDDDYVLVGAPALARATTHPEVTATSFKRDMGRSTVRHLGKRSFRPEELSALVLTELRRDAERQLGRTIDEALVTVPAYFGELQRRATRDACEIAELHVERIINEPTAAALAFGLHEVDRELKAVVLDLGGGTFDVTVLEIMEGVIEIQASAGDSRLGGDDFLDAMVETLTGRIGAGWGKVEDPISIARVRQACERTKRQLTTSQTARFVLTGLTTSTGTHDLELDLERAEVEAMWQSLLQRIRAPIRRALRDADQKAHDIDEVLLVGGATRMPCIAALASELFGRLPRRDLPPDEAVALGAAVQAGLKAGDAAVEDLVVTDVAPFTMGIATAEHLGRQFIDSIYAPILERGTVLPASRMKAFSTLSDNQREVVVQVYQGEHSNCRDNTKLGEYHVKNIPRGRAGEQSIDVRFTYDLNGVLEVESTIQATGEHQAVVFQRTPGALSPAQVKKAREAMASLKFHPRESLPNRTALARADALYAELSGMDRDMLGDAIQRFRIALETQDEKLITPLREQLQSLVSQLRP